MGRKQLNPVFGLVSLSEEQLLLSCRDGILILYLTHTELTFPSTPSKTKQMSPKPKVISPPFQPRLRTMHNGEILCSICFPKQSYTFEADNKASIQMVGQINIQHILNVSLGSQQILSSPFFIKRSWIKSKSNQV